MMADIRETESAELAKDAVAFILTRLKGMKRSRAARGDLEDAIHNWLYEHAIFEDEGANRE